MRRMRHLKAREIQGCQLALDASIATSLYDTTSGGSLVAADGAVARWEDQSGNGYHVTQSTSYNRPLRRVASRMGLDALEFASADRIINSSISVSLPNTLFAIGQKSGTDRGVMMDSYDSSQNVIYRQSGTFQASAGGTAATITEDANWGCVLATFSGSAGKTIQRGRLYGSTASNATSSLSGVSVGDLRGNPNPIVGGYGWIGYLAESCVFNSVLTRAVAQRLIDSRSRKWRTTQ